MSARRPKVRLTTDASQDSENILLYTRRAWGAEQTARYRAAFSRAFERLRQFPDSGQPRDDLFSGCRSIPVEQHIIYDHRPRVTRIVIVRILHGRQDACGEVREPLP